MSTGAAVLVIGSVAATVLLFVGLRLTYEPGEMPAPEPEPVSAPPSRPEIPRFIRPVEYPTSDDPKAAALERLAGGVVVAECGNGNLPLFSAATMRASAGPEARWVDVEVRVTDQRAVDGHTLWYRVWMKRRRPVAIEPMKDVSADACLLTRGRQPLRFAQ
jgi:hypothetical protein